MHKAVTRILIYQTVLLILTLILKNNKKNINIQSEAPYFTCVQEEYEKIESFYKRG